MLTANATWEELARQVDQLTQQLDAARRAQQERDEFLSLMAHDLRTPLTSIRGYAQLLRRTRPIAGEPTLVAGLDTVIQQADRLAALTELLLDVARMHVGQVTLRRTRVDLVQVVRQVADAFPRRDDAPAIEVEAPAAGPLVDADAARLRQVTLALLRFAVERTPQRQAVRVRIVVEAGYGCLSVDDAGPALRPEEQARLYTNLVVPAPGGTHRALGRPDLYVARGLAEAHGGRVAAASPIARSDAGARLSVWLPLAAA